jgi:PadR family transcriptional regulator PadR
MGEAGHSFEAYYKRATSPLVVLRLLQDRTMYGYQISQAMKEKSGGKFTIAVLYPILYRLEEQGYIQVEKTEVTNNRARSYYAITEKGRQYLARTLDEYRVIHQAFMDIVEDHEQ